MDPHHPSPASAWASSLTPWLASSLSAIDHRLALLLERQAVQGAAIEKRFDRLEAQQQHLPALPWAQLLGMAALAILGLTGILKPADVKAALLALAGVG
jgi:hypothetical protein